MEQVFITPGVHGQGISGKVGDFCRTGKVREFFKTTNFFFDRQGKMVQMVREFFLQSQENVREKSGNFFGKFSGHPVTRTGFSAFFLLTSRHKALSSTDVLSSTDEFINFKIVVFLSRDSSRFPVTLLIRYYIKFNMKIVMFY